MGCITTWAKVPSSFGCVYWTNPNFECQQRWRSLIEYLLTALSRDVRVIDVCGDQGTDLTWRGHAFTACPFCAQTLKTKDQEPDMLRRHP